MQFLQPNYEKKNFARGLFYAYMELGFFQVRNYIGIWWHIFFEDAETLALLAHKRMTLTRHEGWETLTGYFNLILKLVSKWQAT